MSRTNKISSLIRPDIQALNSYHVPDSGDMLKMDAMENPHQWPGELSDAWCEELKKLAVNRYPAPDAPGVKQALRELLSLDALEEKAGLELDILLGNGSDEIIQMIAMCLAKPGASIMAPEPSFVMYKMIATFVGMDYQGLPLNEDFSINEEDFVDAVKANQPALIFIAQPNNPTGNLFDEQSVRQIIEAADGLVVLDEAYLAFTDSDMLALAAEYSNVVVMRTLSKVGLAGLRCGFLIGSKDWLAEFDKVRLPYNINVLTQASVCFALQNYATLKEQTDGLRTARSTLFDSLRAIDGLKAFPSEANFILVKLDPVKSAKAVFESMKSHGVLIKSLDGGHPLLKNCLRLTIGTQEQNERMLNALQLSLQ